jgi:hypothetical protein
MTFGQIGVPELVVVCAIAAMSLVVVWPAARICRRLGFSPWLGILSVIPIVNLLLLWFIALSEWPSAVRSS